MLACFDPLTRPLHAEWHKKPLHVHDFAPSRRTLNPESEKIVLAESGIFGGFGIRNAAQGIRNPLTIEIQKPTSTDKDWNPVPGIRNPRRGIQNPRLSWISLHGAKQTFVHLCSGPFSLLPKKRCQLPPMIHQPRPLLLLTSTVHLGLLWLHPHGMSILLSLPVDGPQ